MPEQLTDTATGLPPTVRFSTEELPARDRTAIWNEMISRCLMRVEVSQPPDAQPFHELSMWALPGVSLVVGRGTNCVAARTRELVSDGNDELLLNVNSLGHSAAHWLGREAEMQPGEAILVPTADTGEMRFHEDFSYLNLRIQRAALAPFVANLDQALMRPVPANSEALRLLIGYAVLIRRTPSSASPVLQRMMALHVQDLLAVALGATRDAAEIASQRGVGAARLAAIKHDIAASLGEGPVTVSALAGRHGISPVYIHKLFAQEGTTLSAHVLEQRLTRAYRALSDPALDHRSISAIAYGVGFSDLSHFNHQFRRRFGLTPSDVRATQATPPL